MNSLIAKHNQEKSVSDISTNYPVNVNKCNPGYIKPTGNSRYSEQSREQTIPDNSVIEYIKLSDRQGIAITQDSVWVRTSTDSSSHLEQPSSDNVHSVKTTKKLLDTAIVLGKRVATIEQKLPGLSRENWVWSLISQYHITHSTPPLMREAAQKFSEQGQDLLAEWAEEKAQEETGHDRLAFLDIQSLGYQAQRLVERYISPSTNALINYFARTVRTFDPIKVVGYSYALERMALVVQENHIQAIEAVLPQGVNATRCIRVHSSIGSDVEHVDEALETIAQLSTAERTKIAIACYETARLYFSSSKEDFPTDRILKQKLQPFKSQLEKVTLL